MSRAAPDSSLSLPGFPGLAALTRREFLRFVRQPSRIVAAIGTPAFVWVLLGSGFAGSVASPEGHSSYAAFLLPGMASLTVLFSSIFAAISLIEDRHAGFLQSVLASPAPDWAIVGSKVLGGSGIATAQGALLLLAGPLVGLEWTLTGYLLGVAALLAISVGITGLGLAAAWRVDSAEGFHGVMNLVLMPMWLLSGAFFPVSGAAGWLGAVMLANPLTWPTAALRGSPAGGQGSALVGGGAVVWTATILFAAGGFALAWATIGRRRAG